jgi:hypothetical protein
MVMDAAQFLEQYRQDIAALPVYGSTNDKTGGYLRNLNAGERRVFTTLLPQTAAFRHRRPELALNDLLEAVKIYSVNEIDKVLNSGLLNGHP